MAWEAACTAVIEGVVCECKDCNRIQTGFIPAEYVKQGQIDSAFWELHGFRDGEYYPHLDVMQWRNR